MNEAFQRIDEWANGSRYHREAESLRANRVQSIGAILPDVLARYLTPPVELPASGLAMLPAKVQIGQPV